VEIGVRVPLKTHAPLRLPGMLSTAGHWDQSRVAFIFTFFFHRKPFTKVAAASRAFTTADGKIVPSNFNSARSAIADPQVQ